jgi:predicted nucleic acid-binding protein
MLLDTNIVIYASTPDYPTLRALASKPGTKVSLVSYVEALGWNKITTPERQRLEHFFSNADVLPVSKAVADRAVHLRQTRKMRLGDALIAATALVHGQTLVTRNVADFRWISGLGLMNPVT